MADLNESYIIDLRRALVEAICKVSAQRQEAASGHKGDTLFIGSAEVSETLMLLLSEFVEGVPDHQQPADDNDNSSSKRDDVDHPRDTPRAPCSVRRHASPRTTCRLHVTLPPRARKTDSGESIWERRGSDGTSFAGMRNPRIGRATTIARYR